ncbi:MAG: M23 family metallopeptidase [Kofleriaceae bacterium]
MTNAAPRRARAARWLLVSASLGATAVLLLSSWLVTGSSGAAATSIGVDRSHLTTSGDAPAAPAGAARSADVAIDEAPEPAPAPAAPEAAPEPTPIETLQQKWQMPVWDGVRMDEVYPSLRGWYHPVTGATEIVPESHGRRFGARREGILRSECGEGHCGVDLDGPRGRPMVAVAAGRVVRIERSELGRDGRSGRYVRIEHRDGTLTAYMHMDQIAKGLEVGDQVDGGQYIGTLGATAIFSSAPHCHFTLELPLKEGVHGDHTETRYIDPSPYLVRARVMPAHKDRENTARW